MSALFPAHRLEDDSGSIPVSAAPVLQRGVGSDLSTPDSPIRTPDSARALQTSLLEILRMPKLSGAAIALRLGDCLQCVASSGSSAPAIGMRCYPGDGLTGMCFAKREMLVCNNTERDTRVARKACEDLGVRSVLAIPLFQDCMAVGVLEVLSSGTDAFDEETVSAVKEFTEHIDLQQTTGHESISSPNEKSRSLDLQKGLAAASIIQQHHYALGGSQSDASDRTCKVELQGEGLSKHAKYMQELSAVLSPMRYGFEKNFLSEKHYRSVILGITFLSVVLGSSLLMKRKQASSSTNLAKISGIATHSQGTHKSSPSKPLGHAAERAVLAAAALQGNAGSQGDAGRVTVTQGYASAMAAFEEAAKKGDSDAGWKLGVGYLQGIGVARDTAKAAKWLKKSANLGDVRAQSTLGQLYFEGIGVPRDYVRAYTWASIAATKWGDRDGRLKTIQERMSVTQLQDANHRAAVWFAQKRAADNANAR